MSCVANYLLAAATICAFPALTGANPPQQTPLPPRPINLNVVAVNSQGNPVTDLARKDFQVFDSGKPQQIDLFRHSDIRLQKLAPLAPHELSNRTGMNFEHTALILFDLLNERLDARGFAWHELIQALQPLESSDGLFLYLLTNTGRLYAVHGLPNPEKESDPPGEDPWTRQIKPLLDGAMHAVFGIRPADIAVDIDVQVRLTYMTLGSLASRLAGMPGRKNIVWITHGVPISLSPAVTGADWIDYTPLLRQLSERLDRANVSIYPVQQIPPGMAMDGTPEAQHSGLGSQETLDEFARYTGGRTKGGSDIRAGIQQAIDDVRTSYQIGYRPAQQNWDGRFHKIRVTCARKGVRIQAKEGYYAWPDQPFSAERQQEAIDAAVTAPFDATGIGLRATLSPDEKNVNAARLLVRVDAADVMLAPEESQYSAHLKIRMAPFTADGRVGNTSVVPVDMQLTPQQREEVMKNGISFAENVNLAPEFQKLRLVVLDIDSNAIGSITIPLDSARGTERH